MAKKRSFNYKATMKALRGTVKFNYDLRKKLTKGQKASIRKAANQARSFKTANFFKPPRHRNESITNYNKRLDRIKKNMGQKGTPFTGVFLTTPKSVDGIKIKVSYKGDQVTTRRPDTGFTEKWVGIDPLAFATLGYDAIADDIEQARQEGFTHLNLIVDGAFRTGAAIKLSDDDFVRSEFEAYAHRYEQTITSWLTGVVFSKRTQG